MLIWNLVLLCIWFNKTQNLYRERWKKCPTKKAPIEGEALGDSFHLAVEFPLGSGPWSERRLQQAHEGPSLFMQAVVSDPYRAHPLSGPGGLAGQTNVSFVSGLACFHFKKFTSSQVTRGGADVQRYFQRVGRTL